jgi:hypothetical protein
MKNQLSKCCGAKVVISNGKEGTSYYWCSRCERACATAKEISSKLAASSQTSSCCGENCEECQFEEGHALTCSKYVKQTFGSAVPRFTSSSESWEKQWDSQWTRPVEDGACGDMYKGKRDLMSEAQKSFIKNTIIPAEVERGRKTLVDRIDNICAEFGDNPAQCLSIIGEALHGSKDDSHDY